MTKAAESQYSDPAGKNDRNLQSNLEDNKTIQHHIDNENSNDYDQPGNSVTIDGGEQSPQIDHHEKVIPSLDWLGFLSTRKGKVLLLVGSVLLIVIAGIAAWYLIYNGTSSTEVPTSLAPPTSLDELVEEYPELASILSDPRLDSIFKEFLMTYQEGGPEAAYDLAKQRGILNDNDEVILTLELDTSDTTFLQEELEAEGIIVTAASGNLIDIAIPIEIIQASIESGDPAGIFNSIAGLEHVIRIKMPIPYNDFDSLRSPLPSIEFVGSIETESLSMIGAYGWQDLGFSGTGIKIGIIDPGDFGSYSELLGTELPANVIARSFVYETELETIGNVHGTACAEIIHDIAPDAELFLASAERDTQVEQAAKWLISKGVQIISFSAGNSFGPFDGSDSLSRFVDRVVSNGVVWVNSSGNEADKHYRGTFQDEDGNQYHEFDYEKELLELLVPSGQRTFILNWDDWQSGIQDFNLYLYDEDVNLLASSENIQNGPGSESAEAILYDIPERGTYYVAFYAVNATRQVVFDFFVEGWVETAYAISDYSLGVPATAKRALTVGAVNWENDELEEFSSRGPTADGRLKPELTAPDNVTSAAYGEPWDGTSAACPHVAGAAALVLQAFPSYTPDQVIQFLESRAIDLGPYGAENAFGYGRLWLGEEPGDSIALVPTEETIPILPEVTETRQAEKTITPTRKQTATPSESEDESLSGGELGILICVVVPGLIGFVGIGLLIVIWRKSRSQSSSIRKMDFNPPYPVYPDKPPLTPVPPPVSLDKKPKELELAPKSGKGSVCPRCGISHRPKARFCPVCGHDLKPKIHPKEDLAFCIYCGKKLLPNARFCTKCGKPRSN